MSIVLFYQYNPISFSNTFKTNLEAFRDEVEGDYKKFVYYDDTSYHYVRMSADSMRFTEVAHNVFSTSLNVVEQLS